MILYVIVIEMNQVLVQFVICLSQLKSTIWMKPNFVEQKLKVNKRHIIDYWKSTEGDS